MKLLVTYQVKGDRGRFRSKIVEVSDKRCVPVPSDMPYEYDWDEETLLAHLTDSVYGSTVVGIVNLTKIVNKL